MNNHLGPLLARRGRQHGISLIIALISLIALTLSGLALIRSVDTANVISGNLSFRQASLHATDVGVEAALTALETIITTSLDTKYPAGCAIGTCTYYPTRQVVNTAGVPTAINWTTVPSTTVDNSYSVQYVIDRLCDGTAPITDIEASCMNIKNSTIGSKKAGAVAFLSETQVYYRTTVRVLGPRKTVSIVQVLYTH